MALFSRHQLVFSFLLTTSIMKAKEKFPDSVSSVDTITELEWQTFLQGPVLANMLDEAALDKCDGTSFHRHSLPLSNPLSSLSASLSPPLTLSPSLSPSLTLSSLSPSLPFSHPLLSPHLPRSIPLCEYHPVILLA